MAKRPAPRAAGSTPAATPSAADLAAAQVEADRVAADKAAADKAAADKVEADRLAVEQAETDRLAAEEAAVQAAIADAIADGVIADPAELGGFDMDGRTLFVRSVSPLGRRRAGMAFGPVSVPVEVDDLSEDQLAAILADTDHLVIVLDN